MTSRKHLNDIELHRLYHENSKNLEIDPVDKPKVPDNWSTIDYKTYEHAETVDLSYPDPNETFSIERTIDGRRSPNDFKPATISKDIISRLLTRTAGITKRGQTDNDHLRAYPSGGARYPLEIYPVISCSEQINDGVYHYNVRENILERVPQNDVYRYTEFISGSVENALLLVFVTADLERTVQKYGERGYRYTSYEAGHLMQNLCLMAESVGLGCRPYGGFIEDQADEYLRLNGNETTLYIGAVGSPKARVSNEEEDVEVD